MSICDKESIRRLVEVTNKIHDFAMDNKKLKIHEVVRDIGISSEGEHKVYHNV